MPAYSALGYRFRLDADSDPTLLQLFGGLTREDPASRDDADVLGTRSAGPIGDATRVLLATVAQRAAAAAAGNLLLGGGCVSRPDGGALIVCGPPGTGKTILTARAAVRGFAYCADTLVSIDPETMRIARYRAPLRIRPELQHLAPEWQPRDETAGIGSAGDWLLPPELLAAPVDGQTLFPDLVIFPHLCPGDPNRLAALTEAETAYRLGAASIGLGEIADPAEAVCRLARRAPGYRLDVGDIEEAVTLMLARWESDV